MKKSIFFPPSFSNSYTFWNKCFKTCEIMKQDYKTCHILSKHFKICQNLNLNLTTCQIIKLSGEIFYQKINFLLVLKNQNVKNSVSALSWKPFFFKNFEKKIRFWINIFNIRQILDRKFNKASILKEKFFSEVQKLLGNQSAFENSVSSVNSNHKNVENDISVVSWKAIVWEKKMGKMKHFLNQSFYF